MKIGMGKKDNEEYDFDMTNEEYREALASIFTNIHENYKLKWFYRFIVEKLKG